MKLRSKIIVVSGIIASLLQGCATPQLNKPVDALFRDGEQSFQNGNYEDAIALWKRVKESYPSPDLAARTEISIADAYFLNKEYIEAAVEYESFRKLHPSHERAGYALYRQGMSYFKQIKGIDTDQTPVKNALAIFESYLKLYPAGAHTAEVQEKVRECRDKQLQYEIYVGKLYLRNGSYPAAIARFETALKLFSGLPRCEEVLPYLGRAYRESGQKPKAREAYERLLKEYPGSPFVPEAKKAIEKL
jgi:outer membrane protein assembly factor BamD